MAHLDAQPVARVQSTEGRIFQYLFDERLLMTVCATGRLALILNGSCGATAVCQLALRAPLRHGDDPAGQPALTAVLCLYAAPTRFAALPADPDEARFFNSGPLDVILKPRGPTTFG